jgi:hypothetical protein
MKKECSHTRKALPKYLRGHLFKLEQIRIERHLRSCVVCYSQYETLKRADETRKFLKDITPPEGVVQIVKEGVSGLGMLKKILYRPLWILSIVIVVAVLYYVLSKPRQLDMEIDKIVKTAPSRTAQSAPAPPPPITRPATVAPPLVQPAEPVTDPLLVVITADNEKAAIRRINAIMGGHGQLRKYKFTDMVREISGSLTSKELLTFFNRIDSVGKVSYSRKRLEAFPSAQPIPFVMRLTVVQKAPEEQTPPAQPLKEPVEEKGSAPTVTAPTSTAAH